MERHARASTVEIYLRADNSQVSMEIVDDGVGFDDGSLAKTGALGLLGIRERFGALGGTMSLERNDASGTTVSVRAPAPKQVTRLAS